MHALGFDKMRAAGCVPLIWDEPAARKYWEDELTPFADPIGTTFYAVTDTGEKHLFMRTPEFFISASGAKWHPSRITPDTIVIENVPYGTEDDSFNAEALRILLNTHVRKLLAVVDEVDHLRNELRQERENSGAYHWVEALNIVDRLRAVIDSAPHDAMCDTASAERLANRLCTCWKADVL